MSFYVETLRTLVDDGLLDPAASTLVLAGGLVDRAALLDAGFGEVTISNLDERPNLDDYRPYSWAYLDAEDIDAPDRSFDQVIVHAGLHHCRSPHRGLTEMYRVARRSIVVFEARDSLTMRAAARVGLGIDYEVEAVVANDGRYGGLRDSGVPNHVYRWTEREVHKTLASCDPTGPVRLRHFHGLRLPDERLAMSRSRAKRLAGRVLGAAAEVVVRLAPRQGNEYAFWAGRPTDTWPWLVRHGDDVAFDHDWAARHYRS